MADATPGAQETAESTGPALTMTAAQVVLHDAALTTPEIAAADPERLLLVPVIRTAGETRYVLVRWPDWPHPALLSFAPPVGTDTLEAAAADLARARLGLVATAPARQTTGWLRGVLQPVEGEPTPDVLVDGCEVLSISEAEAVLTTEVERMVLRAAAALG
jgi:nucleotide-binding universal stress UspA family protein